MIHRYRFISEYHATYGVTRLCRVLAVGRRQGYYEWVAAQPARQERAEAEDDLAAEIRTIHGEHKGSYGSPRVTDELRRRGRRVNRKRVERIMRERHIVGITRRRRRSLTKQDTTAAPAPDLIGRDFTSPAPGHRLVGDITYLPTQEGWLYLATTIDLFNREVVGHAMAEHMRADLVCGAVELAHRRGLVKPRAIFHSDYAEFCVKPRIVGWPVVAGWPWLIPRLNDPAVGGYRPSCPFALRRGDGHGYDGHRDRVGCCHGVAGSRLHGVDDRPVQEVDQSVDVFCRGVRWRLLACPGCCVRVDDDQSAYWQVQCAAQLRLQPADRGVRRLHADRPGGVVVP
ncbi:IS3 family transposase [Dactylosporangium sp. CA-092794]|uniref:IS3 family transposase n=1 Tax=Dactylosporangium sp. CA-092794 TaxID=3239929 RepID=UPI003D8B5FF4